MIRKSIATKDFATVPFVGTKTFTLELVPGKYR